jgi:hypothetical protein
VLLLFEVLVTSCPKVPKTSVVPSWRMRLMTERGTSKMTSPVCDSPGWTGVVSCVMKRLLIRAVFCLEALAVVRVARDGRQLKSIGPGFLDRLRGVARIRDSKRDD